MLSQRLLSELSRLDEIGQAQAFGAVLDQTTGATRAILVPDGQVFLVTHIMVQAETLLSGVAGATPSGQEIASPGPTAYGIRVSDTAAATTDLTFLTFRRWQQTFVPENSPNWRNAPPDNIVGWEPKYPIPIPSGWTIKNTTGGEFGNMVACYGYLVSEEAAKTLGYRATNTATAANRRMGFTTGTPTTSFADLVAARADKCIRILDIYVRIQAETNTTNKVTLAQTDGRVIFSWTNNNPSDLKEAKISPEIFLKAGQALQLKGTIAGAASVCVTYEYVDLDEVPSDSWWAYVEPDLPTPNVTRVGAFVNFPAISTAITCYYPGQDSRGRSATTKTSPTQGFQHVVRGFCINIQKDTTFPPDQTLLALSTGASAGNVELSGLGITQGNVQISPTFSSAMHDQCVLAVANGLNIPCKKDDGAIYVDTIAAAPGNLLVITQTPISTDADIDEWSVTVWGKTIPSKWTNPSNRGT